MNIVLFEPGEWRAPLDASDVRAAHLIEILKLSPGDRFAAGELDGPVGTLEFQGFQGTALVFSSPEWKETPPQPHRLRLIIGTPRPPTARRLMKDLTTLGAAELHFTATELGDRSYLQSTLWSGEYRKNLWEGAAQARTTRLPAVMTHGSLRRALTAAAAEPADRVWFDESGPAWDSHEVHRGASGGGVLWLAVGPERGWSEAERTMLTDHGWTPAKLGPRTLRTETAAALATGVSVLKGWL